MSAGVCPRCAAAASGNFCASCGASLAPLACPSCGTVPAPGARFCPKCGTGLAGQTPAAGQPVQAARGDAQLAWWLAGGMLVILIVLIAWPVINPSQEASPPTGPVAAAPTGAPGGGTPPDLSTMTPRQAADRLYERVMSAVENGDEATVQQFIPMALQAYEIARPLDDDGLYHLATLKRANGDLAGAIAIASEGLASKPDHLLLLAAAAEGAEGMGDLDTARRQWTHYLEVYDVQHAMGLEEYLGHENVLAESRVHAREFLGL